MTDVKTIAISYIDLWNERTPARRREILAANWAPNARYVDPLMSGDGHDGVDALIAGVQQRFPDFRFTLIGEPNGYGDHVRFPGDSAPTAPTARSRARISPCSATAASAASPGFSIRCRRGREVGKTAAPAIPGRHQRHCEWSEAIHPTTQRKNGLLRRFASRNDGVSRIGIGGLCASMA